MRRLDVLVVEPKSLFGFLVARLPFHGHNLRDGQGRLREHTWRAPLAIVSFDPYTRQPLPPDPPTGKPIKSDVSQGLIGFRIGVEAPTHGVEVDLDTVKQALRPADSRSHVEVLAAPVHGHEVLHMLLEPESADHCGLKAFISRGWHGLDRWAIWRALVADPRPPWRIELCPGVDPHRLTASWARTRHSRCPPGKGRVLGLGFHPREERGALALLGLQVRHHRRCCGRTAHVNAVAVERERERARPVSPRLGGRWHAERAKK